jgi:hypothetical protein
MVQIRPDKVHDQKFLKGATRGGDQMPDAESETRLCPYCKEEVKAVALRCKHCLADIAPTRPDHGGVCPLCREEINADAIRCKHCKATLVPGARSVLGGVRRPARIIARRPVEDPVNFGGRRPSDLPAPDPVRADRAGGGCAQHISTRYGIYHLVDEGIGADGWHYCGYEPGFYGVFDDDDLVPYRPTILSS